MNAQQIVAFVIIELIRQGIPAGIDLVKLLLKKEEPTDEDWDFLRAKWKKDYDTKLAEAEARYLESLK